MYVCVMRGEVEITLGHPSDTHLKPIGHPSTINQCQVLVDTIKKKNTKKIEVAAELAANNNGSASFTD